MGKTSEQSIDDIVAPSEVVLKVGFMIDGTGAKDYPVLEICIIANKSGLAYLSRALKDFARKADRVLPGGQTHIHLGRKDYPFNRFWGDDIELRIELLSPSNREQVFEQFNVSSKSRRKGSMIPHLKRLCASATDNIRREMKCLHSSKKRSQSKKSRKR